MSVFAFTRKILAGVVCLGWLCFWAGSAGQGQAASPSRVAAAYEALPLKAERNEGQWTRAREVSGAGRGLRHLPDGSRSRAAAAAPKPGARSRGRPAGLAGANAAPRIDARARRCREKTHYLLGADAARWRRRERVCAGRSSRCVPGRRSCVLRRTQRRLEYDFLLAPARAARDDSPVGGGRGPATGGRGGRPGDRGRGRELRQHRPVAYQDRGRRATRGRCAPPSLARTEVAFEVGASTILRASW